MILPVNLLNERDWRGCLRRSTLAGKPGVNKEEEDSGTTRGLSEMVNITKDGCMLGSC
jgi:hypothetical protein